MWSETASSAKLYLPLQWQYKNGRKDDTTCTIDWDSKERILKILNEEQEILGTIYPMDIIGVNVEFQMSDDVTTMMKTTATSKHLSNSEKSLHHKSYTKGERVSLEDSNHDNSKDEHSECYDAVNNPPQAIAILNVYAYPKKSYPSSLWSRLWSYLSSCHRQRQQQTLHPNPSQRSGRRYAQHYSFPVVPMFDLMAITDLARAIRDVSGLNQSQLNTETTTAEDNSNSKHRMTCTPRKCIVILNPKSGRKKASQVWNSLVQRMLEYEAGFEITFFETLRPDHATEYLRDFVDLDAYDTLLCLGGDGIIHEVISGLYLREDVKQVLSTLRLGVIGCGTGNGLAKSLTFASGVSTIQIIL
jgi:Diacylglycerol kinase catalytic domain